MLAALLLVRVVADRQRRIAGRVLGIDVPSPYRPAPPGGPLARLWSMVGDPMTWRDLGWLLWAITLGWVISLLVVVLMLAVATLFFWWFGTPHLMALRSRVDLTFLTYGATERLEQRVAALTRSRAEAVDHSAAELRRLERDLHDGTQARLVAVSMSLGMAEAQFDSDPEAARRTVNEAREATSAAIADLRSVVRGIHPPVLADRGLDGAIRALALDMAVPVEVTGGLAGRPPLPIESAVYFAVAECLANSAKHAGTSTPGSSCATTARCCASWSATTAAAAPTSTGAPACGGSCGGWRRSTARCRCPAPTAAPRSSPWRCRAS